MMDEDDGGLKMMYRNYVGAHMEMGMEVVKHHGYGGSEHKDDGG